MNKYIDIKIEDNTLAVDADGLPIFVSNQDSIIQDIKHMIRESGYLVKIIAERSKGMRQLWLQNIILLVEEDERIIPGTVVMETMGISNNQGIWTLSADTYEFNSLTLEISA